MRRLCIFGDSITWGADDLENGGWATLLKNHFLSKDLGAGNNLEVYVLGISGDNSDDLVKRFDVEKEARDPDGILLAIGINDAQFVISKGKNRVSINTFRSNLEHVLGKIKNLDVYILGLTRVDESKTVPVPWNTDKEYRNRYVQEYDDVLKELSETFNAKYIDVSQILSNDLLPDGLHPNAEGHRRIFEIVKNSLEV